MRLGRLCPFLRTLALPCVHGCLGLHRHRAACMSWAPAAPCRFSLSRLHTHAQAVEDKIRRWEENPDAELQRAAAAREITVYFNSDVAGAPQPPRC